MADKDNELRAGFTGKPTEKPAGIKGKALTAANVVKREGNSVIAGATDHPHTASTLLLGVGALAFAAGFMLGRNSAQRSRFTYW